MSDSHNSHPPVTGKVRAPKTWDFMETLFVALVAYAVYGLMSWLAYFALVALNDTTTLTPTVVRKLVNVASIFASGAAIAVLWVAIRMAGRNFAEYLALNWPNRNELLLAFAVVAVLVAIEVGVWPYESSVDSPFVVGGAGGLFVLLVSSCLAVPIMEEFVLRGFMFRGWSESFLGPIGAIVLTSALFGIYHTQYEWFVRIWIFLNGLALCFFRWRSNSTWLAAVMHSAINIILLFLAGPYD